MIFDLHRTRETLDNSEWIVLDVVVFLDNLATHSEKCLFVQLLWELGDHSARPEGAIRTLTAFYANKAGGTGRHMLGEPRGR